jgi:hypothetical protein
MDSPRGRAIAEIARAIHIERNIEFVSRTQGPLRLSVYTPIASAGRPWPVVLNFGLAAWRRDASDYRLNLDKLSPAATLNLYPPACASPVWGSRPGTML